LTDRQAVAHQATFTDITHLAVIDLDDVNLRPVPAGRLWVTFGGNDRYLISGRGPGQFVNLKTVRREGVSFVGGKLHHIYTGVLEYMVFNASVIAGYVRCGRLLSINKGN
jgi:hypothetical protein